MAISYVTNSLITKGNLPLDARTVTTFDQMPNIKYPFVGMQVYVTEEESTYLINQDCLVSDGDGGFDMNPDINELRKHCVKIATSDNILEMIDGSTIIGPSGNSIIKRYCLGTKDAPNYSYDRMTLENQGWEKNRPSITDEFGFVWSIEAIVTNNNTELVEPGWSETPLRENGVQGVKGDQGLPGETTAVAYLDNPMDSVLLDADNNVTSGFPCSTNFYVYQGTVPLRVTNLVWEASEELASGSVEVTYSDTYATLTIKKLPTSSSAKVSFTLTATVNGIKYKAIYLINKITASAPNIVVDMANDNINIPCDSNGIISDGVLPLTNAINAFKAGESMVVTSATTTTPGVTCSLSDNTITISQLPNFTNVLTVDLNITLNDGTERVVSFRIIKVVPGAPGQAAEFWEISTESPIIKVNSNNEVINTPFKVYLLHREGLNSTKVELGNSSIPSNIKLYYSINNDNCDTEVPVAGIDLSNAIMGELNLDRYLSLALKSDDEIIDGPERIYMIKDGEQGPQGDAAVIYRLVANNHIIKKDNVNGLKNDTAINISILRIDGETSSTINVAQLSQYTGDAYDIYKYTDGVSAQVTSDNQLIISTSEMEGVNDYIRYELVYAQTGSGSPDLRDSVTIDVLYDGVDGADGRIMYYDGEWVSGKTYTADDTSTPYVYDKTAPKGYNYLFLVRKSYSGSVSPYNDWNNNKTNQEYSWKPIPNFEAIYANVGMFDTATVGPAVFYKDWVFSQTDVDGGTSFKTFDGDPINGAFKPATWFNFKTGAGSLAKGNISWTKDGNVTFGPDVKLSWNSITGAPGSGVTAMTAENLGFVPESGQFIRVDKEVTFKGQTGWYLWVHESDLANYEAGTYPNGLLTTAFTQKPYDNTKIGDRCWAGTAVHVNDNNWDYEEMDDTTVTSVVGESNSLTEDDVTGIIQNTYIDGSKILVNTLDGNAIKANSIDASKLKVDTIDARNVNTIPEGNGSITITGNDMVVRNSTSTESVMKISGDYITSIDSLPSKQTHRISIVHARDGILNTNDICLFAKAYSGSINLTNSTYFVSHNIKTLPKLVFDLQPYDTSELYKISPAKVQVFADICFVNAGDEPSYLENSGIYYTINLVGDNGDESAAITTSNPWTGANGTIGATSHSTNWVYYYDKPISVLSPGSYDVYVRFNIYGLTSINGSIQINQLYLDSSAYDFTFTPTISVNNFTEIGRDGIRVMKNTENYFYTDGNDYIVRNEKYAFGQNATEGFWITLPSKYTGWDGTSWYKYSGLQMNGSSGSYTMVFTKREEIANVV